MMASDADSGNVTESLLPLDDSLTSKSYASFRSATSTLSQSNDNHHHHHNPISTLTIVATSPANHDPLLSPPSSSFDGVPVSPTSHDPPHLVNSGYYYSDLIISLPEENITSGRGDSDGFVGSSKSSIDDTTSSSTSGSSRSEYLRISVTNPQKEQELSNSIVPGGNTFVTYLITTKTNMWGFGASDFSVRRRFRDVVTLADRLAETFRGYFVPPRPDKSVVESQVMHKQEFVEHRRVALEKYLMRLAAHPVIRKSNELRVFLQVPGKLPLAPSTDMASRMLDGAVKFPKQLLGDSVLQPHDVAQPAKGGRDLLRLFKEMRQSLKNDLGSSRPPVMEEDNEFLEKKDKLHEFELRLTEASKQAGVLVKAQQDIGNTMGELGLSLIKLTKFENEKAVVDAQRMRAAGINNAATTSIKASRIYRELNSKTVKNLDTLHDYLGSVLAARNAFSDRSSALLTVQTLLSDMFTLQSRVAKLESKAFGGDKAMTNKIEELKEAIRRTEDAKNYAVREYERIKENNRSEFERLDRDQWTDLLFMLKGFVNDQVSCAEKMASLWEKLAEATSGYTNIDRGNLRLQQ